MIVTIDGPAGSGKSTTARGVAERLKYVYLDTGAMYRAVALAFVRAGAEPTTEAADDLVPSVRVDVWYAGDEMRVSLNDEDVTDHLRAKEVNALVSQVATLRPVRERMVEEQRRVGREKEDGHGGIVVDGRDTGTVVFPGADVKIFMVADVQERARRRQAEYQERGEEVPLSQVRDEIRKRDERDRARDIAPLRRPDDAVTLDSTHRSIEEQVQFVVDRVKATGGSGT